ncbi:MAG: DJ-1/PfpI family protein [Fibrobacteria bacterium]
MAGKILLMTGDGGECYEVLYAVHRLREAGFVPVIGARSVKRLHLVIHDDEPGWDTYKERPGYEMNSDIAYKDVKVSDFDATILIGGRAPEYLRNDPLVLDITRQFEKQGKYIFIICHGIQIAIAAGIIKGKTVTCYEHLKFEIESCGGTFIDESSHIDGKIVSAKVWADHPKFFANIMACMSEYNGKR